MESATITFALLAALQTAAFSQTDPIERIVSRIRDNRDYRGVTPDVREEVLRRMRAYSGDSYATSTGAGKANFEPLIRLGDELAMKQVVDAIAAELPMRSLVTADNERKLLLHWAQPVMIPFFAVYFFQEDGETQHAVKASDVVYMVQPVSMEMCVMALEVIRQTHAFSPETKAWARKFLQESTLVQPRVIRAIMREWWRANESHFAAKDYRAVKPGKLPPPRPQVLIETVDVDGRSEPAIAAPASVWTVPELLEAPR